MATLAFQPEQTRTGPSEAVQIVRNLWKWCGPKYALLWLAQGTLCRLLSLRLLHIIVHEARSLPASKLSPPAGYEVRIATREDIARGVPDDPTFPDHSTVQRYLASGDVMIAAFHGGQIVSYGWCSSAPAAIGRDLFLSFGPRFLYGHRAYTTRRHRGKGLHAAIITCSRSVAAERGQSIVAYVDANNYRSLISEARVGPMHSGLVMISLRPGKLRYWASELSRRVGLTITRT